MNILFLKLVEMYTLEIMAINLLAVTSHYSTNKTRTKNKAFCYYIYLNECVHVFSFLSHKHIFFFSTGETIPEFVSAPTNITVPRYIFFPPRLQCKA